MSPRVLRNKFSSYFVQKQSQEINVELKFTFFTLQRFGPSPSPNLKQTCIQRQFLTKFGQALPKFN